ncbi:class I SAM-dependent methyltransferase [Clostridium akagii]|uniref:class I SAM-dependent methyltransferase n=1 Tax=Clostridium akagii TaxID=91623 RepID=UPI00047C7413|nr:class I SAM-dependent methyltransferase [Clostridium akagii]
MEYMGNKEYWDEKFVSRSDNPLNPEKSIVENIEYFKNGTILDIACGDGRNALFLAEKGFKVTGVDFSSRALERLEMFAKRYRYSVNTLQIDLSTPNPLNAIGIFDNVLINHYRLNKQQLKHIESHITDEGILFICGFGYKHKVDSKIREEDLIQATDFEDIENSFELINDAENLDDRGFFVTYIFRKRKS